jgi:3-oxoacyl-[acyl-carrier protein] reductase
MPPKYRLDFRPQRRPEELAEYAAFMVSDRNSFMNGEVVIVDGGAVT